MIDRVKISPAQFMVTVICFVQSSSLLSSFFTSLAKQDSWMVLIAGSLVVLPLYFALFSLFKRFPGKTLVQINDAVFGKYLGKLISVLYIWFFLTLGSLNLRDLGNFAQKSIMPNTPVDAMIIPFILLCAWAVRHGLDVITRYNSLFFVVSLIIMIIATAFVLNIMCIDNLLPMLDQEPLAYVQSTHISATIPCGELVVLTMIVPNVKVSPKKLPKYWLGGFAIAVTYVFMIVFRDTTVLGNTLPLFAMPPFETLRLINVGHALSRVEILFATVLIILLFAKISLIFYAVSLAISQLFNIKNFKSLVFSTGAILCIYSLTMYESVMEHSTAGSSTHPVLWTFFEYFLPFLTLAVAVLRGLKPTSDANKQQDQSAEAQPAPAYTDQQEGASS